MEPFTYDTTRNDFDNLELRKKRRSLEAVLYNMKHFIKIYARIRVYDVDIILIHNKRRRWSNKHD